MVDCFTLLGVPRQPWLDGEFLQKRFHELSMGSHPDRVHGVEASVREEANRRHAALNSAYATLSQPKERLAHLLELENGARPQVVQSIPEDLMELCMEVGAVCRRVDSFLAGTPDSESPMLKVQRFAAAMGHQDAVQELAARLGLRIDAIHAELRGLNRHWADAGDVAGRREALKRIEELWRLLSYLGRWTGQLQERNVRLVI